MLPAKCPVCKHKPLDYDDYYARCSNCKVYTKPLGLLQRPLAWARQRRWWWRLPIFIWFVFILKDNLRSAQYALDRMSNPLSALDLGIHELGHMLFSPFGEFMHILGGSLFQCLFPIFWLLGCLQKRWYFAASLSLCWLGLNLFDVATYAADARSRLIPLSIGLGIFGIDPTEMDKAYDAAHDWYQLLSRTGNLNNDLAIAHNLRIAATIIFLSGLVLAGILLLQMVIGTISRLRGAKNPTADFTENISTPNQ